jgi:hypothetical protein
MTMRNLLIIVFLLLSPSGFADEKKEQINQVIEIAQLKAIMKKQRLETPPNIK